jgi:hypothetical protein
MGEEQFDTVVVPKKLAWTSTRSHDGTGVQPEEFASAGRDAQFVGELQHSHVPEESTQHVAPAHSCEDAEVGAEASGSAMGARDAAQPQVSPPLCVGSSGPVHPYGTQLHHGLLVPGFVTTQAPESAVALHTPMSVGRGSP